MRQLPLLSALLCLSALAACTASSRDPADPASSAPEFTLRQQALTGPGLGNLSYTAAELNKPISFLVDDVAPLGHQDTVAMVQGYLMTIYIDGQNANGSFSFWDVSNPRNPQRVHNYHEPAASKLREAHAFGMTKSYGGKHYTFFQSNTGFQVWDLTDPAAISLVKDAPMPGSGPGNYTGIWWLHLQAPYVYLAGAEQGLYVVDARNIAAPVVVKQMTNAQLGITRLNQAQVIGNLMIVNYSDGGTGVSLLDISDPANPTVKYTSPTDPATPYATLFNGGKWATAGKLNFKLSVYDLNFDSSFNPSGLTPYGVPTGSPELSGGGYVTFQDGFVHAGFSNHYAKFDIRSLPITQTARVNPGVPYDNDMDFAVVLGNLVYASNDEGGGSSLIVHQMAPDTTGPSVNFVSPLNNATNRNVKSRVGLTFTDELDIDSINTSTIIVRPPGGSALPGKYSLQSGIVNFFPDAVLAQNTTYEIVVPAGGVRDLMGNPSPTTFFSVFSTGNTVSTAPSDCSLGSDTPALVSSAVGFSATGCVGNPTLTYSWSFGDGSPPTAFSTTSSASRTFTAPGHYNVILTVRDGQGVTETFSRRQTVTYPVTASKPTRASTIASDATRARVYVVNSDGNTVAALDSTAPFAKRFEVPVGASPRTLALPAGGGDLWVANQDDGTISVLDGSSGASKFLISLPAGSRPHGIAFNPAGTLAYVTLEGTGRLLRLNVATRAVTGDLDVGPRPRGLAVSHDGNRILVSRFVSPDSGGQVREVSAASFSLTRTFVLPEDTSGSTESSGPGLPNYVQAVTITPDGRRAWIPSKKDNIHRGTGPTSDGVELGHDSRVRTIVSKLDLVINTTDTSLTNDIDNADLASAVVFSDLGDWAFVATQGSNRVEVLDALSHGVLDSIEQTGLAPRGLALVGNRLFVHNFMSRDVAVYDVATAGGSNNFTRLGLVSTQATESLSPQVLQGKKIFYNAADPRMSAEAYTSCASCHLDGDNDGRAWDFTQFGEGLRATASLLGRGGVSQQGPVHWSGNFDEIQDFENDIRGVAFGGTGFMSSADFLATSEALGAPKAGRSPDLDALAAYVSSLTTVPPSPFRAADGGMTAEALAGKALFESAAVGCATCHTGAEKTDSALGVLHDVGTITAASGRRNNQPLIGFDTPTLLGVWATAPYLHDNSAATLLEVITSRNPANQHGATSQLSTEEKSQLVAYLSQLDERPPTATAPGAPTGLAATATSGSVSLTWFAPQGALSYNVKRATVSGGPYSVIAPSLATTSYADSAVTDGVTYYYVVSASNSGGEGPNSAQVSATPVNAPLWTSQDIGAVAAAGSSSIAADGTHTVRGSGADIWTANDEFRYVHQSLTGDGTITARLVTLTNTQTFTKAGVMMRSGLGANAVNVAMIATPTATNKFRFQVRPTAGATTTATNSTPNSVIPVWLRLTRAGNTFKGFFSTNGTTFTQLGTTQTLTMASTISVGLALTSHLDGTVATATFDSVVITTPAPPTVPGAPPSLTATAGNGQVALAWGAASGASSYNVKRATISGGPYTTVQSGLTGTSFTNTGLSNGTTYYYVVTASNAAGEGPSSAQASATPALPPPPAPPTGLTATPGNGQVVLSWSASSGATSYTVKRGVASGGPYDVIQSGLASPGFTNTGLSNGTTYHYVVTATGAGGESASSLQASATPTLPPPPPAPTGLTATPGNAQVALSWNAASGASSYTVKRSTVTGGPYTTVQSGITATSYTNTGLTNGTPYHYVVTATGAGGESAASTQVSATPVAAASWLTQDVGGVGAAGSFTDSGGTYTVRGSGVDIWSTADEFRFAYRNVTGNVTLTARLASVQNIDAFTKAGLMMRDGLGATARNVAIITTPTAANGHRFQSRTTVGGTTAKVQTATAGTAPVWFRLVRSSNTFTASYSTNGTTWTQLGTATIAMAATIQVGMAITSHVDATLASAVFDSVTQQ